MLVKGATGNTWVCSQHCDYWCPGAKAPSHQYPQCWLNVHCTEPVSYKNKANLRDLIAATGLVILLKLDSNHRFFSPVTSKFNGWPQKIIGHLFYTTSSFVHHFKSIGEFKLELQSGNAPFGSKSTIFLNRVILQFDGWPWKTIGHLFYATSSFVHHFVAIGEFKVELQSGNTQFGSNWTIFWAVWP